MADKEQTRLFVRQGFASYPAALEAIEVFESEVFRALRRAFDEKPSWQSFKRARGSDGGPIPPKEGRSGGAARWLWSFVGGEKRGDDGTWLTLGLCWSPPKQRSGMVVAYASFTVGNRVVNIDDKPGRDPRVKLGSLDRNERRPFIVVGDDFDVEEDFRILLDAIDAGIPAAAAGG